ncbi:KxYKxGKxW signal peptide domain-containing protein, partial [Leuconostoc pseudomesenteroides]|uniref:KxYKxGKxW signal peptide domain-containing protein n=2 Tax=Leuconostoc TaxID=1243 RepID=UPI0039EA67B8
MSKSANNFTPVRTIKFKMYKAKKQWMMAALAFMAGAAMMTDLTTVSADDNATQSSTVQTNTDDSSTSLVTESTNGDFSTQLVNNQTSSSDIATSNSESDGNGTTSLSATDATSASSLSTGSNDNSSEAAATSTIGALKKTDTLQSVDDALSAGYVATGTNETIASNIADKTDAQAIADEYVGAHVGVDIDQFYSFDQWQNLSVQSVYLSTQGTGPIKTNIGPMQSNNSDNRSYFTGTINLAEPCVPFVNTSVDGSTTLTAAQVQSFLDYIYNNLTVTNSTTGDTYVLGDFVSFNGTQKVDSIDATGYFPVLNKNGVIAQDAQGNALSFYTTLAAGDSIYKNSDLYISFGSSDVIPTYSVVAPVFDATVPMESESASTSESTSSESASLSNSTSLSDSESTSSESASLSNSASLSDSESTSSESASLSGSTSLSNSTSSESTSLSNSASLSDSESTSSESASLSGSTSLSDSESTSSESASLSNSTSLSDSE